MAKISISFFSWWNTVGLVVPAFIFLSCSNQQVADPNPAGMSWPSVLAAAKGKTVVMNMHMGDKKANSYMHDYVVPALKKQYDITLAIAPGQGKEIINNIMSEKESGNSKGQIDLCWINGETFYQLRQLNGLYGPFTNQLPNARLINFSDPLIRYDFQEEVNGFEAPWGKAYFFGVTDTARVRKIPITMQDFSAYWKEHPGRFTIPQDFMGLTLLKSWLIELAGGISNLDGPFNEERYQKSSAQLWKFVNDNKQYFWKNGETFPASGTTVSQLFGNGELDFTFAFGNADADKKVAEGIYPPSAHLFILAAGCTSNTNYLGIPFNASVKPASMVVCNFLLSPEAQVKKSDVASWGSDMVLDYSRLDPRWKAAYDAIPPLRYGLPQAEIRQKSIKETNPEYMIRIADDFRKNVIDKR